jgi:DNA-binding CsgD family transcriptional regulator
VGAEWPFVGRADELRQLRRWLTTGERQSVVLAGAPGVGKTRLALECLHAAEDAGFATARVHATRAAAAIPFGALAPLLPAFHHEEAGAVDDRADLLRRSAAALVERTGGRRLVLFIDDAHLLDDASATLIHQLAVTGAASLLVTVRTGEATADPIVSLWKDGLAERFEVEGLDADAIEEVLASALGGRVDRAAVAHLAVRCQGNVLFLRELVIGALHDGTLRDDSGIWRLAGRLSPSDRLVELVESRLSGLSTAERDLLEVVSLGEPLGAAELLTLGDPGLAEVLERKGILRSQTDDRRLSVRLAHPLYGDVLRSRIPALRVRDIARSLAESVEACGQRRREDTLRVATWRLDGGGARPEVMLAAATTARWRYDFPLAERLARAALDAGAGFDAAVLAAQLASLQGRGDEAEAELAALADQAADDAQRGLVAITRLDNRMIYAGTIEEGLRLVEQTEITLSDPGWRDEVTARRGALLLATSGPRTSAETLEPLLERAEGRALVWACMPGAHSLGRLGRIEAALAAAARGRAVQLTLTRPMDWYPWTHLFYRGEALGHAGRLKEAEALATAQYHEAVRDRSVEGQALFTGLLAKVLIDRGRVRTAVDRGREAVALYRQLGRPQFEQVFLVYVAHGLALAGQADAAAHALATHDAMALPPTYFMGVDLGLARAWTAVAGGDLPQARRLFEAAATSGLDIGDLVGAAAALHGLARLGRARDVVTRLTDVAADIEGDLAQARAAHALALAPMDAADLTAVSERFEAMGAVLLAAEAAADAAVAWRRADASRDAAAAERRVATLVAQCEGATTPALGAVEPRSRLTAAERETALLAAAGRSNRDIADELCVSVRTIENRLMHVYEKLGITGRAELAAALSGLGLAG